MCFYYIFFCFSDDHEIQVRHDELVFPSAPRQVIGLTRPFGCGKILAISKAEQSIIKIYKTATELINDVHPLCPENSRTIAAQNHTAPVLLFESKLYRACSTGHYSTSFDFTYGLKYCSTSHLQPAVNRQPGYRWVAS